MALKHKYFILNFVVILSFLILLIPESIATHFWSSTGFSVSRVGNETFDTLANFSKQGDGCSIINNQLNCPANSGVTYAPQPNPDGSTLPNLNTNTNNFTIEWDMQILSSCEHEYYPTLWGTSNTGVKTVSIHYNDYVDSIELRNMEDATVKTIGDVYPDNTWQHYKATFYANTSSIHSVSIAINGTNKANIQIPESFDTDSMSFQYEGDHCSINADNLTMYNGTEFPFEIATLTVIKIVVNNDTCTLTNQNFTLKVNETVVRSGDQNKLRPGYYNVNEVQDLHYAATFLGDCDSNGNIALEPKQNKMCIIVNDDIPTAISPPQNGSLLVITNHVNSSIFLNSSFIGNSSNSGQIYIPNLAPSDYLLRVEKLNYTTNVTQIRINSSQNLSVQVKLNLNSATPICSFDVRTIPANCTGTITQDTKSGNCRTLVCNSAANSIKVFACNKPDSGTKQFFEMYRQSSTVSPPKICIGNTCVQNEGFKKSPLYPFCT